MQSGNMEEQSRDYYRIEKALYYLQQNMHSQPSLEEIARSAHLSPHHFQRLFKRWAGISPKRFLHYLTIQHAKRILDASRSLLETSYRVGLSSPGRLHDLFITFDAVTPGAYKKKGAGLHIHYGFHPTPFGMCLLAVTEQGISNLWFILENGERDALQELRESWPGATIALNAGQTGRVAEKIFSPREQVTVNRDMIHLHLKGTNFQIKVWEALLNIPPGHLLSYEDIAAQVGSPQASRAAAGAVAKNPVSYLIPCHRVIRKVGELGGYRWGTARKMAMLGWEAARKEVSIGEKPFKTPELNG